MKPSRRGEKGLSIHLPAELIQWVVVSARQRRMTPAELVRKALLLEASQFLMQKRQNRSPRERQNRSPRESQDERLRICDWVEQNPGAFAREIRLGIGWTRATNTFAVYLKRIADAGYLRTQGPVGRMRYYRTRKKLK